jgi:catalase
MQVGDNGGAAPNYRPNSFDDIVADETYKDPAMELESVMADYFDRNENDNDHYTQPGMLYRKAMNEQDKKNLVTNIVGAMSGINGEKKDEIINRQLCHFFRADIQLGIAIASGLGVTIDDKVMEHA